MNKIKELTYKSKKTLKEEGLIGLLKKCIRYFYFKLSVVNRKYDRPFKDILFINGCSLPHPQRYRVDHQIEQLESYGLSCDKIYYTDLTLESIKYYRAFVFYRCPILPIIEEFITQAKENNKTIFYDIDDLVFDTKYTNQIKYVQGLTGADLDLYNDGVTRMGKTLDLCEYAIASTKRLAIEMSSHVKDTYINRNVASDEMIKYSKIALNEIKKDDNKIIIGYFSGTITHNDDFKLIMPTIIKILKKYDNVYLKVVGLLDLPEEMLEVKNKIITSPFVDWKDLQKLIASTNINIAPLEDTIFNEAKSENKWTEAALVKVPMIASNVGAFKEVIKNDQTGLLCNNGKEWEESLIKLIENKEYRQQIGINAYNEVMEKHITTKTGKGIADFIRSKLRRNFVFILPSPNVSGGVMVAIKHGIILKNNGYDVTMININKETENIDKVFAKNKYLYVVPENRTDFQMKVDTIIATMWLTLKFVQKYPYVKNMKYLVQNRESEFYENGKYEKKVANATYANAINVSYITISKWCQEWLNSDFSVESKYAPNGIDLNLFTFKNRNFEGKIKILIEGNSKDYYKNVDESFKIVDKLNKDKFEIHYLSYQGEPKKYYYVDKFYHKVPHDEVVKIYQNTDILIKSSILESFSYPPLEMMATGGICIVCPNGGNIEYLKDNENCLLYEQGNIEDAVNKINMILKDRKLRDKLIKNGLETAKSRDWNKIEKDILYLYI